MSYEELDDEPAAPPPPEGTVSLALDFRYDAERLAADVMNRAAGHLAQQLQAKLEADVKARVAKAIDAKLDEIVAKAVERKFVPVGMFGEPSGEPTSIAEILVKKADTFLEEQVDSSGRRASPSSFSKTNSRAAHIVEQMFEAQFNRKVEAELKKLIDESKDKARLSLAAHIVTLLSKEGIK